jgi:hypothetical protein
MTLCAQMCESGVGVKAASRGVKGSPLPNLAYFDAFEIQKSRIFVEYIEDE